MSYIEAFAQPRVYDEGLRFGATGTPRRHNVAIRAPGAKEIRVNQTNNGTTFLKGVLKDSITVKTLKNQNGSRSDSPAKLSIRVFWKAGGDEWFPATAVADRSFTLIPSPGMAGSEDASNIPGAGSTPSGGYTEEVAQGYPADVYNQGSAQQQGYDQSSYESVAKPTPWGTIFVTSLVAASAGYLGFRAIRG